MRKLYLRIHNVTGLKYVGTTKNVKKRSTEYQKDNSPWRRHLDKYGYDFSTQILYEMESDSESSKTKFYNICTYFSLLNNIHNNPDFANQMVETGKNGSVKKEWCSKEYRKNILARNFKSSKNPNAIPVTQINLETGEEMKKFKCHSDAEIKTGINQLLIGAASRGDQKTAGGFGWQR